MEITGDIFCSLCHGCHGDYLEVNLGCHFCEICNNINKHIGTKNLTDLILSKGRYVHCFRCDSYIYISLPNNSCKLCNTTIKQLEKILFRSLKNRSIKVHVVRTTQDQLGCIGSHNEENINFDFIFNSLKKMNDNELKEIAEKVYKLLSI